MLERLSAESTHAPAPRAPVKMVDIARMADVSVSAVSLALNGRPGVSDKTRSRIVAIATDLGWFPNAAARALSGARAGTVGLVLTRPARQIGMEPFYMSFISGLEATLSVDHTGLLLQFAPDEQTELDTYRRWFAERRVDGLVLIDLKVNDARPAVLSELGVPFVVIGDPAFAPGATAVWTDDATAIRTTVARLVELGHRRLGRVSENTSMAHTTLRTRAFVQSCRDLDLPTPFILEADASAAGSRDTTRAMLASALRPTAVVYDNNIMAVAGLGVAHELGLSVPDDLSLVAYDDSLLCESTHPALSAISHDVHAYGENAGRRLLDVIAGAEPGPFLDSVPALIERGSSGPAATAG